MGKGCQKAVLLFIELDGSSAQPVEPVSQTCTIPAGSHWKSSSRHVHHGMYCTLLLCKSMHVAALVRSYLRQDLVPNAHISQVPIQAALGVKAAPIAVLILPQHQ